MTIDHAAALQQIGPGNLMAVGAHDFVHAPDALQFSVGSKRGHLFKLVVSLGKSDTYSVRFVDYLKSNWAAVEDVTESGVHAEDLGATVRRMGDR